MVANRVRTIAAGCVACAALAVPTTGAAQNYRYADDEPAVVVECAPGQRAVMAQRRVNGSTQVVARCEGTAQAVRARTVSRSNSNVRYGERAPQAGVPTTRTLRRGVERTKTKTALMIAGSAATGAGVGGALKGKKGAIIGAAIGGGSASIYEAAKRR
jgi:hypothetical protein